MLVCADSGRNEGIHSLICAWGGGGAQVVYALLHRQEVFEPFKEHPRFRELLENIHAVLAYFNSRMDDCGGEWSVERVLGVVTVRSRPLPFFSKLRHLSLFPVILVRLGVGAFTRHPDTHACIHY